MIYFGRPIIGAEEKEAVLRVLEGPVLTHGPLVKEFEAGFRELTGAPHAVAVASCTAALHLAHFHLRIGPGDEVIVPAETHVATAHAVELCGGTPVFVDVEPETGNIDLAAAAAAVTPRTRAISVVHYLGLPADMDRVAALAKRHGLFVVEDAALAIGSRYKGVHAGLHGDVGCFSFYPVKHITTAEGGMMTTRSAELADAYQKGRAFGIDRNVPQERKVPGMYDVEGLGFNYRMNELGAAMGVEQLRRVPAFLAARRANYEALSAALEDVPEICRLRSTGGDYESSYYCHSAILSDAIAPHRVDIMQRMKALGVETSIYYPRAVPMMSYYRAKYGFRPGQFPAAERISDQSIALSVGPHLGTAEMERTAAVLKQAIEEVAR
jgi:dTDP-4-amino-4,6-dideoxygalactose transaminase